MSHAPNDYVCPFCEIAAGVEGGAARTTQDDVVYRDSHVTALISLRQWPNNRGHAIVIPNEHYENLYDLPLHLATRIHDLVRGTALALKQAYGCEGTSTRQHNEPVGGQDVWHYHVHVFPRYAGDNLYGTHGQNAPAQERAAQAAKVRAALAQWKPSEEIRAAP